MSAAAPKRKRRRRTPGPLPIAFATLAVLFAIVFIAFNGGLPFRHGYRLHAVMSNTNALRPGSPVRVAGVGIGKVTKIGPGPGNTSIVDMDLEKSALPLHADASIQVKPRLFVEGGFYVALSPGSPSAPDMPDGGTIPLPNTRSAVQLSQLLSTFDRPVRGSLKNLVKTTAGSLSHGGAEGLRRAAAAGGPALKEGSLAVQAARGLHPHDASGTIIGTSQITGALAEHDAALGGLIDNLDITARALSAQDGALGQGIAQANAVLGVAPASLTALDRTLPILRRVSDELDPNLRAAPPLLRRLSTALDQFETVVNPKERPRAIKALRATLVDFPDTLTSLTALIPAIRPVTDCVTSKIAPMFEETVPDGALSTKQPVWQELAHTLPNVASAAQNFDGNGYTLRYQIGVGPQTLGLGNLGTTLSGLTGLATGGGTSTGTTGGGGTMPVGSTPTWLGKLGSDAFNPGATCTAQPLPKLDPTPGTSANTRAAGRTRPGAQRESYPRAKRIVEREVGAAERKGRK